MLPNDQAKYQGVYQGEPSQPIRGVNAGAIFSRAFSLYRENFGRFITIALLTILPAIAIQLVLSLLAVNVASSTGLSTQLLQTTQGNTAVGAGDLTVLLISGFVLGLLLAIPALVGSGATIAMAGNTYLGRRIEVGTAFRIAFSVIAGLLVLLVLEVLLGVLRSVAGFSPAIGSIVAIAYLIFAIIVLTRLQVARQAVVLEGVDGIGSLSRSWNLIGSDYWGAAFGLIVRLVVILVLPLIILLFIVLLLVGASSGFGTLNSGAAGAATVISLIVGGLIAVLITPIFDIAFTILYIHLRGEREQADAGELLAGFPPDGNQKQVG